MTERLSVGAYSLAMDLAAIVSLKNKPKMNKIDSKTFLLSTL
ncbi:hypothetical protein ACS8FD_02405 [Psychrobacter sp. 1U2]